MRIAALFLVRLLLGLIFFWQGFGKVFVWKITGIYERAFAGLEETFLPDWLLWAMAYYTSFVELICGTLVVLGLWRKQAYLLLASVLIIVAFGHGAESYIWDIRFVLQRAVFLILLMLLPMEWDRWSLDEYLRRYRR